MRVVCMLSNGRSIVIRATELSLKANCIIARLNGKKVAVFRISEIMACWLEGSELDIKTW